MPKIFPIAKRTWGRFLCLEKGFLCAIIAICLMLIFCSCHRDHQQLEKANDTPDAAASADVGDTGDAGKGDAIDSAGADKEQPVTAPQKISAESAQKLMSEARDYILVDVRTEEEYIEAHIEGAILIPDYDIEALAETALPDKGATIIVYCRSGRRSASAAEILAGLGYNRVYDLGGIIDWPYETVSGP
jgi:rhodanese-related sulfurtransferase